MSMVSRLLGRGVSHAAGSAARGAAALAFAAVLTTVAFAQATQAADLKAIEEAAKTEGEMTWYISLYGQTVADKVVAAFEKKYPGLKVVAVRRSTGSTFQRLNQDLQAKVPLASVVTMSGIADYYSQLKDKGDLAEYTPENGSKLSKTVQGIIDPGYVYPMGGGLMALAYNSSKVSAADAPKNWTDIVKPEWKGKLALGHPGFSGFDAALDVMLMRTFGWEFFEKIEKNDPLIQRTTFDTITALASGERLVAPMADGVAIESINRGNPLKIVYPEDGTIFIPGLTAILKNAPQPNTAKLFTEFLLGPEQAQILVDNGYDSVRPEVETRLTDGRKLSDIKLIPVQPSAAFGKDLVKLIGQWRDLFGQ